SFVATSHSLWWNNIKPVFVDIEPEYCNIDAGRIEEAITPMTTAILAVHVYGNPCNVEKIRQIAQKHGLKVIYDAAHAFGNRYKGESLLNRGDLSTLSFHATKPYNTMEGGAIVCHDEETKRSIDYLRNFGFDGETKVVAPGINSKMNEMQAALGLLQLKHHDENIEKREKVAQLYRTELAGLPGISLLPHPDALENNNNAYFPVFVEEQSYGKSRDALYFHLRENGIFGRRYFYPLISSFPVYRDLPSAGTGNLPVAEAMTRKVICLPIYPDLPEATVKFICGLIRKFTT
ncbi:MAG: DegT/DnrJ/EryC1/StrS family aminotransferase, partial [Bacteroidales bacterium]